jgi:hypothetical protein
MARLAIMLSSDQVQEVEALALLNQEQIADYFGISRTTFKAICCRDDEVRVRYKRGKAKAIAHVANGLLQKARTGDTTSMIFYLKTQASWRETAIPEQVDPPSSTDTAGEDKLNLFLEEIAARSGRVGLEGPRRVGDEWTAGAEQAPAR